MPQIGRPSPPVLRGGADRRSTVRLAKRTGCIFG